MMTTKKGRRSLRTLAVITAALTFLTACGPPGAREARQGEQLVQAGQFADAIGPLKAATEILATAPPASQSKVWNLLGLALHGAKQFDAASVAYGRALKLDRNNVAADYNLGCLRLDQTNFPGAIDYLTTYVTLRGHDANGYLRLGDAHYHLALERGGVQHNALIEAARQDFEKAERLGATAQGPNALGVVELQRRYPTADSIKNAAKAFQLALERDPHFAPALLNLAVMQHQFLNQPREALQNYRKYLAINPPMPHAREVEKNVHLLDLQLRITITPEPREKPAAPPAQSVVPPAKPRPVPAETPPPKASALVSAPPPPRSPELLPAPAPLPRAPVAAPAPASPPVNSSNLNTELAQVEVAPPQSIPPPKSLAQKINPIHWFSSEPKMAEASAGDSAGAEPPKGARYKYPPLVTPIPGDRPQALRWIEEGAQARQQGRLTEAVRDYQQAVQADPTSYDATAALGLAALDGRDYTTALEALYRALRLRGDSAEARYAFAWTLQKRGYFEDAARELEKLLAAHPEEVRGHLLLGNLYAEKLRQPKLAREQYARALELDPQNAQAAKIRAWIGVNR